MSKSKFGSALDLCVLCVYCIGGSELCLWALSPGPKPAKNGAQWWLSGRSFHNSDTNPYP